MPSMKELGFYVLIIYLSKKYYPRKLTQVRNGGGKRDEQYMGSPIDTGDFWNPAPGQHQSLDTGRVANPSSSTLLSGTYPLHRTN